MSRRIVNILNFVRASEPRNEKLDLVKPVAEQIKLNKKYNFKNTFLLQYDALLSEDFKELFKREADENMEIGIWFECVRQLVEKCGLEWRGAENVTWDWHIIPGFLPAYKQEEKKLLIDEFMRKFKEVFGYLPKSVGSWLFDSWSVDYMASEYNINAVAICREQYGIDAYTLWGGYMNQGYYPSKKNILCPAQSAENRVKAPILRMLGPDPIYNYDEIKYGVEGVPTIEPAWVVGQDKKAVEAIFKANFEEECMDFSYVTVGQENSFGWDSIGKGLPFQLELLAEYERNGKIVIEKLCETGEWFKNKYTENPVGAYVSNEDWAGNDIKSIWFNCQNYRANLLLEKDMLYFRDIYKFDEAYEERYLKTPCQSLTAVYDNLPVVDGRLWNDDNTVSGLKLGTEVTNISVDKKDEHSLVCNAESKAGKIKVIFDNEKISIEKPKNCLIYFERGKENGTEIELCEDKIKFVYNGYSYSVSIDGGICKTDNGYKLGEGTENVSIYLKH